jgi:ankyrin repeat protein
MTDPGNGNTTIHIAAQNGNIEMLQVVMGAGAHVNQQNKGGQTALHMVSSIPQCSAVQCSDVMC